MTDESDVPVGGRDAAPPPPPARPPNPVLQAGWKLAAAFAFVLVSLVVVGLILPGEWSAEAERTLEAPPDSVYARLASPRRWDEWTPFPEGMAFRYEGPEAGEGAHRAWDDTELGAGSLTILEASPPSSVRYRVEMGPERGQTIDGRFRLEPAAGGTRVIWTEEGDLGRSPVFGWAALSMRRRYGDELARRLDGLAGALGEAP